MGKTVIRCVNCNNDKWIPRKDGYDGKECSKCGVHFCAKNRIYSYEK